MESGISICGSGQHTSLVLTGEIDLASCENLHSVAMKLLSGEEDIHLEWDQVHRLSSGAIQVLLALEAGLDARGRKLRAGPASPGLTAALRAAGFETLAAESQPVQG